jgi:hypothetical protein
MTLFERARDATIGSSGYPNLARDRSGGFGYLAILLLIVLTVAAVITSVQTQRMLRTMADRISAGPDFTVEDGLLTFRGTMPYHYYDDAPYAAVIVDTTGQTGPDSLKGYAAGVLITKDTVYQTSPTGAPRSITIRQFFPQLVTRGNVVSAIPDLWQVVPFAYVFIYVFQLGAKLVDACLLAFIGLLYATRQGYQASYALSFKLSLYAMTLPIMLQWLMPGFTTIPMSQAGVVGMVLWWGLSILYLTRGLQAYYQAND